MDKTMVLYWELLGDRESERETEREERKTGERENGARSHIMVLYRELLGEREGERDEEREMKELDLILRWDASHVVRERIKWREFIHGPIIHRERNKLVKVVVIHVSQYQWQDFPLYRFNIDSILEHSIIDN